MADGPAANNTVSETCLRTTIGVGICELRKQNCSCHHDDFDSTDTFILPSTNLT